MNYVIGDIHNDNRRFYGMLKKINFSEEDQLFLLGDLFDRNLYEPDPIGVYFNILKLENRCTVIRGNHDTWLAKYIMNYFHTPEKKRKWLAPYPYNSFTIFLEHLTQVDMIRLAEKIMEWPLHYYLMGSYFMRDDSYESFLTDGKSGYVSVCGHTNIMGNGRIWKNKLKNVYMCDCGCGFADGRLGCLCLETREEIYIS